MTCSAARNGASSSTYITARAKNDATRDSAPTTGLRCSTTTSAKITATAAKKKKMANCMTVTGYRLSVVGCSAVGTIVVLTDNRQPTTDIPLISNPSR